MTCTVCRFKVRHLCSSVSDLVISLLCITHLPATARVWVAPHAILQTLSSSSINLRTKVSSLLPMPIRPRSLALNIKINSTKNEQDHYYHTVKFPSKYYFIMTYMLVHNFSYLEGKGKVICCDRQCQNSQQETRNYWDKRKKLQDEEGRSFSTIHIAMK